MSSEEKAGHPPWKTRNVLFSSWSVTPTTESFANVNRLVTITSVEVLQLIPHLNCVRRDTGGGHSHAHSWKYVTKSQTLELLTDLLAPCGK